MSNVDICPQCQQILPFGLDRALHFPLAQLLCTNHAPTDPQRRLAEEVVADLSLSIRVLEEQISRFRKSADRLRLHRQEHEALLSKFRDFPAEILELIFQAHIDSCATRKELFCIDDLEFRQGNVCGKPQFNSRMAIPLTISMVCRQWRRIALSMPSLWSNIHLSLGFWRLGTWEKMIPLFMERVNTHRLSIDLDLDDRRNAERGRLILDTFGTYSDQWKEGQFLLTPNTLGYFAIAIAELDGNLPKLEFLSIGTTVKELSPVVRLAVAPSLHALQLINIRCNLLSLPWSQLRDIALFQIDWHHALELIELCPNLTSLRYEVFDDMHDIQPNEVCCRHQCLTSLELIATPRRSPFLDTLELPTLRNLTLTIRSSNSSDKDYALWPSQTLCRFLSRAPCTLQAISLDSMDIPVAKLAEYLPLTPNITTLKLTESNRVSYDNLLELVAVTKENCVDSSPILPNLGHLEYTFYAKSSYLSEYTAMFELVSNVIRSRHTDTGTIPLKSVTVRGPRPETDAEHLPAYSELLGHRQNGILVETYFFSPREHLTVDVSIWNGRRHIRQPGCITITEQVDRF